MSRDLARGNLCAYSETGLKIGREEFKKLDGKCMGVIGAQRFNPGINTVINYL